MKRMISYKKAVYILIPLVIASTACNKILDVSPDGYVSSTEGYYKTQDQLETALTGIYATFGESYLYRNGLLGRSGLDADEGFWTNYNNDRNTVSFNAVVASDIRIQGYWSALYLGINRANVLLANVDNPAIDMDPAVRGRIKGEALFLRGYYYFLLVSRFGGVPLVLTPTVSSQASAIQIPRSTTKETYDQVIRDMEAAEALVFDITDVGSGGRVNKSAVRGMLSRVCLYMGGNPLNETAKFAEAAAWAQKVIASQIHDLNPSYENLFITYAQDRYDIKESLFEVEFWGNATGTYASISGYVGIMNGIAYPSNGTAGIGYSPGYVHPTQWLFDLYTPGDLRRDWAIAPYRYVNDAKSYWTNPANAIERYCGKFRRENELLSPKSTVGTPINFPMLRYSDVLLMYAEALNEVNDGPTTEAYEAVNQVRRRGFGFAIHTPNVSSDFSGMTYDNFKAEIKKERARELCFEGLRKNDVVRWGDYYDNMRERLAVAPTSGSASYVVSNREYFLSVTPKDVIWPIPAYEIGVNPKLVQNQGW